MAKFHIPVIAEVECGSFEEAREIAYNKLITNRERDLKDNTLMAVEFVIANDGARDKLNRRIFFLHPQNVDCFYDVEEYEKQLLLEENSNN